MSNPLPSNLAGVDWDDVRICLAVARAGTASSAGLLLGLSHTTVLRRIAALEKRLGVVLFHKRANGYEPNETGAILIASAEQMEAQVGDALAQVSGTDDAMRGPIRLSLPDVAGGRLLSAVRTFCKRYPDVSVLLEAAQRPHSLTSGEAHVAVTLTGSAPPGQLGAPIGPIAFAAYASKSALVATRPDDLPWIGFERSLHWTPSGRIDRVIAVHRPHRHQADSLAMHRAAILSGLGVGLLPCAVGDFDPRLRRCGPVFCDPSLTLWVLYRRELRTSARVAALARHLRITLIAQRAGLAGERPNVAPLPFAAIERLSIGFDHNQAIEPRHETEIELVEGDDAVGFDTRPPRP